MCDTHGPVGTETVTVNVYVTPGFITLGLITRLALDHPVVKSSYTLHSPRGETLHAYASSESETPAGASTDARRFKNDQGLCFPERPLSHSCA